MNNSLDKVRIIDLNQLNSEFYFPSLLELAYTKGLLSDPNISQLEQACLTLLADKTERYNMGDSSSIPIEKAQGIMASNVYTIGLWLKTYPTPDDAVIALQQEPLPILYRKGRKRIDTMLAATKIVQTKLLEQLFETRNMFYRSTIEDGINGFFKFYYPDFAAQEHHITADYPVFNPMPKLTGVEFIHKYVHHLYYENMFCCYFAADDVHHLLCGYEKGYAELLLNIYEPVLLAAIGCTILGRNSLSISSDGRAYLEKMFAKMTYSDILTTLGKAVAALSRRLHFSQGLHRYVQASLPQIAQIIEVAVKETGLDRIFPTPLFPENNQKVVVSFGEKMDDEVYRKIIEEISQCRFMQDKIAIIKAHVHTLADLDDLLQDVAWTEDEIISILSTLSLPELAAISKRHQPTTDSKQHVLCNALIKHISSFPKSQQALIASAMDAIAEEC